MDAAFLRNRRRGLTLSSRALAQKFLRSRQPGGTYLFEVACGIYITIMHRTALLTGPLPHVERFALSDVPAIRTALRGREPAVYLDQLTPVPRAFVTTRIRNHAHS